jgi:hypothetical protein
LQHHAFEQVIYVVGAKLQLDSPVAINFTVVLEETDAGVEQYDPGNRKFSSGQIPRAGDGRLCDRLSDRHGARLVRPRDQR